MNFIIDSHNSTSINQIGNKAWNLLLLKKISKTKVPEFSILVTDAYSETLKYNGLTKPTIFSKDNFKLPPKIKAEIYTLLKTKFKNKKLVIRSSTVVEDSPLFTFAGQYSSFLGIRGINKVIEAIRKCYNSLLSENAKIYSKTHKLQTHELSTAIIIQELAPVSSSGILFTADPVFGNKEKLLIESVKGLGDNLTSGKKRPNYLKIDKKIKNKNLFLEKLRTLAINAEEIFGNHRDIEWGYNSKNKQLYLFQSRPITFGNTKNYLPKTLMHNKNRICVGSVASRGKIIGRLKVIKKTSDLKNINKGDIIYTKKISNKFINVMAISKGLLFEGGILSHISIIMREFKKPCLTNLSNNKLLINHANQKIILIAEKEIGQVYSSS